MKYRHVLTAAAMLLFSSTAMPAQQGFTSPSADTAYWVNHWAQPHVIMFGPEEEAFYKDMQEILFPWNDSDQPSNPAVLESDAQWLKDHPGVRFYITGYASSRGELIYNLVLSQQRAEWVKQALMSRGIAESRIVLSVGWGQLYPVCPELEDSCWAKNRRVRFVYVPG